MGFFHKRCLAFGMVCALAFGLKTEKAWAIGNAAPLDLNRFHPALGEKKLLTLDLADVGPHLQIVPQLFLNYSHNPFVYTIGNQSVGNVISHRLTGELGFALSLWDRIQIGLALPVTLYQTGDSVDNMGKPLLVPTINSPVGQEDLRISIKVPFYRNEHIGVGIKGDLYLPTGNANQYLGSRYPMGNVDLLFHAKYQRWTFVLNVGGQFGAKEQLLNFSSGLALRYGIGTEVEVFKKNQTSVSLLGEFYGQTHTFSLAESTRSPMELMIAAKVRHRNWTFFAGVGPGIPSASGVSGAGTPDVRAFVGVQFHLTPPKKEVAAEQVVVTAPPPPVKKEEPPVELPQAPGVKVGVQRLELPERIQFAFDSADILDKSFPVLQQIVDILKQYPQMKLRIDGHTDFMGTKTYNDKLSSRRVASVEAWLIQRGISADRLSKQACGKEHPIDFATTDEAREKNRRVEFVIVVKQDGSNNNEAIAPCGIPQSTYTIETPK